MFSLVPGAADPWIATRRYEELARLLGEAVRTGDPVHEVGRRAALRSSMPATTAEHACRLHAQVTSDGRSEPEGTGDTL